MKDNVPSIAKELLRNFRLWLTENDIKNKRERIKISEYRESIATSNINNISSNYSWIEKLLQTTIPSCRKYCLFRILVPYLVNVKRLTYEESFKVLEEWFYKCNNLSPMSFDSKIEIKSKLKGVKSYLLLTI